MVGEIAASSQPAILQTLLGSCVSVCLRDPVSGVGGMNHMLLPGKSTERPASASGVNAMELLINEMMRLGADRRRLVAKAFGAANVLAEFTPPTVGDRNAAFVRDFLATERIPLVAERLGGNHAVHVHFRTDTGRAILHSVDGRRLPVILRTEKTYLRTHFAEEECSGEITLF